MEQLIRLRGLRVNRDGLQNAHGNLIEICDNIRTKSIGARGLDIPGLAITSLFRRSFFLKFYLPLRDRGISHRI